MTRRYIHSSKSTWEISDLLQSIFVSELLNPSHSLWIVSPWISDIPIIDNRSNQFVTIEPQWANRMVLLSEVIAKLIDLGTRVIVGLKKDEPHNPAFISKLEQRIGDSPYLRVIPRSLLHAKGIISDRFYLSGSMNITFNGISLNEETVLFVTDMEEVAHNRIAFKDMWGGIE